MRTHTTYDSDKLLCILRSVSPTCDNNEADPYAYMWIMGQRAQFMALYPRLFL